MNEERMRYNQPLASPLIPVSAILIISMAIGKINILFCQKSGIMLSVLMELVFGYTGSINKK